MNTKERIEYIQKHLKNKSQSQIARELGVSHQSVNGLIKRHNLKAEQKDEVSSIDFLNFISKQAKKFSDIQEKFNMSESEVMKKIEDLMGVGYNILSKHGYVYNDTTFISDSGTKHTHEINKQKITLGIVSDTHIGSIYSVKDVLDAAYTDFLKRGVDAVYHGGDISEGYYKNRPGHLYELNAVGFDQQKDKIVEEYPSGILTYFITGNHDATHIKNGGSNIGPAIAKERSDMIYLGMSYTTILLTDKCSMDIVHPIDGTAYALSYKLQKRIDVMQGGNKPNILLSGHYHKYFTMFYRNIHSVMLPSTMLQSDWMKLKGIHADIGYVIIEIEIADNGQVDSFKTEFIPFYR